MRSRTCRSTLQRNRTDVERAEDRFEAADKRTPDLEDLQMNQINDVER